MPPLLSIVGKSNTGKTTLIEKLIPVLKKARLKISTIKHTHHNFEIDYKNKDSYRHKAAGAFASVISGKEKLAIVLDSPSKLNASQIAANFLMDSDLVLVEGFKDDQIPKLEVISFPGKVFYSKYNNVLALISNEDTRASVPVFQRDAIKQIAEFILKRFL